MSSSSTDGVGKKPNSLVWMIARIVLLLGIAGGVFYGVRWKIINDEMKVIEQENIDGRIRDYDPTQVESRGGPPPGSRPRPQRNAEASADAPAAEGSSNTADGSAEGKSPDAAPAEPAPTADAPAADAPAADAPAADAPAADSTSEPAGSESK